MKSLSVETERGTSVLKPNRDGTFHVSDPKLAKKLKQEGLGIAGVAPAGYRTKSDFTCKACGFASLFKKCGKCGEINE